MDFGGGLSIPSGKGLNKNFGNTTISSTQSQSHLPTPITEGGLSFSNNVLATINYHCIHVQ
jgi:hypothetical protein